MKTWKIILIWVSGFLITVGAAVFQRKTGPTYPYKVETIFGNIQMPRSFETDKDGFIIKTETNALSGVIYHVLYPSDEYFAVDTLLKVDGGLKAQLPPLPAAGKIMYKLVLTDGEHSYETPMVVGRYKNPVPSFLLIIHIFLMFFAMLLAVVSGLRAVFNQGNFTGIFLWSGILLLLGGVIFGAMVQKYAFGVYWSGFPLGSDVTDNKTLLVLLFFAYTIWKNYRKPSRLWTIMAVIILLLVYSIPHSLYGSELNHETGKVHHGSVQE